MELSRFCILPHKYTCVRVYLINEKIYFCSNYCFYQLYMYGVVGRIVEKNGFEENIRECGHFPMIR